MSRLVNTIAIMCFFRKQAFDFVSIALNERNKHERVILAGLFSVLSKRCVVDVRVFSAQFLSWPADNRRDLIKIIHVSLVTLSNRKLNYSQKQTKYSRARQILYGWDVKTKQLQRAAGERGGG